MGQGGGGGVVGFKGTECDRIAKSALARRYSALVATTSATVRAKLDDDFGPHSTAAACAFESFGVGATDLSTIAFSRRPPAAGCSADRRHSADQVVYARMRNSTSAATDRPIRLASRAAR